MGLDGCMKCIKYSLFIFNFIFWLVGAALAGFGIYLCVSDFRQIDSGDGMLAEHTWKVGVAFAVLGTIVMLLGFLGCCGSLLENKCMLVSFFILMTLVFLALLAAGTLIVLSESVVLLAISDTIHNSTANYYQSNSSRLFMDTIHSKFGCCGVSGLENFKNLTGRSDTPDTCLTKPDLGCVDRVDDTFVSWWLVLVIIAFAAALVTLIGMVCSMMLCCALRDAYD